MKKPFDFQCDNCNNVELDVWAESRECGKVCPVCGSVMRGLYSNIATSVQAGKCGNAANGYSG